MDKKQALGRGLSSLFQENNTIDSSNNIVEINLKDLEAGKYQPRKNFDETNLNELAKSISKNGVIQPIIVKKKDNKDNKYIIIAGERRYRASKIANVDIIPAIIRDDLNDKTALEFAIIENIQRQDLNPIEESESYKRLIEEFKYTHEQLSKNIGKSRSHISNMLRLLNLPDSIKILINKGDISIGHARAILKSDNPEKLASEITDNNLSVRDVEKLMRQNNSSLNQSITTQNKESKQKKSYNDKSEDIVTLENTIKQNIGLNVNIMESIDGGNVSIKYSNIADLDKIIQKLCN